MASAPKPNLPLFYQDLMPLNTRDHASWNTRGAEKATWIAKHHAIPLTVDEFVQAQRHFPIVFSAGENPVPLALMGLNEGINTFVDDEGTIIEQDLYIPAYARRYPFLLAKLDKDSEQMSLCFDPTSEMVGDFDEGNPLFVDGSPSEAAQAIMEFCENFEQAGARTQAMVSILQENDLLMDGEVSIQPSNQDEKPFVYRGFKMIDQEKLRNLSGEKLNEWNQSGMLPLIWAHLFSLELMRTIFARQVQQGKGPNTAQMPPTNGSGLLGAGADGEQIKPN